VLNLSVSPGLSRVSLLARQIFYVHHFFIALVLAMIGLLTLLIPMADD
jgi:hypothetical protein